MLDLHWVSGPENQSVASNGQEERSNLLAPGVGLSTAVDGQMPDDDQVGDAGDGVPAPLLRGALAAKGGKQASKDHDDISNDGHEDVSAIEAGKETEVEQKQRCGQSPVNIASPEDLTLDLGSGVRNVVVLVADNGLVDRHSVTGCHGKVGEGSNDDNESGNDMVETPLLQLCELE